MILTTLGTSHGDHTYCRYNSATLVEIQARSYLIDCGEPASATLIRANKPLDALRAVMMTHMHGDHIAGLPNLLRRIIKYPRNAEPLVVYLPEESAAAGLIAWLEAMHVPWPSAQVELRTTAAGPLLDDGVLRVTALPTGHLHALSLPSYGYLLEGEGRRVVLTGDLRSDFSDFPRIMREEPTDLCFCEVTHYDLAAAVPVLARCPIERLVFYHVHNPWHGARGEERLHRICAPLPFPYSIAHDGDVFEVGEAGS